MPTDEPTAAPRQPDTPAQPETPEAKDGGHDASPRPLSQVLVEMTERGSERISLEEIATALADRSFAAMLLLFAAPNMLPLPPGASGVLGAPLVLIAFQLMIARDHLWLPNFLRKRSVDRSKFRRVAEKLRSKLERLEKLVRPRMWPFPRALTERYVGVVTLLLAVILALPIPFNNMLPAFAIVVLSLGLMARDGLWLLFGTLLFLGSVGIIVALAFALDFAASELL